MTSIGTGYDLSNSTFSPDGRVFQVEYAAKAVESAGTTLGIKTPTCVVIALEKLITSKLLLPGKNRRMATVDRHIGVASSGLVPDGKHFAGRCRDEAANWRSTYKLPIGVPALADRMGQYVQAYTLYSSVRPFGMAAIVGGADEDDGTGLYLIEPSGAYYGYHACATGKGKQLAKNELEKLDFVTLSAQDAIAAAARIVHQVHDEAKDKDFELELGYICLDDSMGPQNKGKWVILEGEELQQVNATAKQAAEADDEEMEE
ncbi:proteasome subunit alpha type-3 [Protomyces lactucae-debilis]|uniref:Proteasome subunit alpha type n=1 Tax=Protomyces lactucae-debilis TaxID=2754530 RepID=A0A1Y2FIA8_PROLT|nr:proteasome subunit alpha type-3 [Protomyces lactucae-debilis]ORY82555.1 proteasome subunit alpha type-3 [Protomyces lactucae-debilis]